MQQRKVVLTTNEVYHIFNRSVGREQIFTNWSQLQHISETVEFYRYPQTIRLSEYKKLNREAKDIYNFRLQHKLPLVEIFAYSFMPNHFHFLLRQTAEDGIKQFISLVQNSYAKYFNTKYDRHGGLFQSPFQGKWVENDDQFVHISRYIHLNPVTSFLITIEELLKYQYSSYACYCGSEAITWVNTKPLLQMFSSKEAYRSFVEDQVDYQQALAKMKDLILE